MDDRELPSTGPLRSVFDVDAILKVASRDPRELSHTVRSTSDTVFTWGYALDRPQLRRLYEKAKTGQWNASTDIPWHVDVDPERAVLSDMQGASPTPPGTWSGTPLATWGEREWADYALESRRWMLSQFLHGEQGALLCTSRIVETVPWFDAKLYAATQVVDEARHVEVFARYLDEKMGGGYQVNAHLGLLLDDVVSDPRWDMTYLGMQIMVEGLALAAFGFLHHLTSEPLLKHLLRYVMSDEARHVAFGVLSLQEVYAGMSDKEIKDRQVFVFEASLRMRDRFLQQEVWERLGVDPRRVVPLLVGDPNRLLFQRMLFSKIVPNCRKLGLLDRNDGWLRRRFEEMKVLEFEFLDDTGAEVDRLGLPDAPVDVRA